MAMIEFPVLCYDGVADGSGVIADRAVIVIR
jgi:hypothetical protein